MTEETSSEYLKIPRYALDDDKEQEKQKLNLYGLFKHYQLIK